MRILVVEDDPDVAEYVRRELEDEGNSVTVCHDGAAGLRAAELTAFDIILLDVMLPFMDGLEVTRRLRRENIRTPILLLTARDAPEEMVRGLDSGADDYLTKPFSFDVLLARIRVRTRAISAQSERLRFADLALDLGTREARRGKRADCAHAHGVLHTRVPDASGSGRVVSRDRLIEEVWGERDITYNNLEVFIRFLRAKVDGPRRPSSSTPSAASATGSGAPSVEHSFASIPSGSLVFLRRSRPSAFWPPARTGFASELR